MSKPTLLLVVDDGPKKGENLEVKPGSLFRIGRVVKGNKFTIKDPSISQNHIALEFISEISRWAVKDLETSNGTFVNDARIPSSVPFPVSDGDVIKIGGSTLISVKIAVGRKEEGNLEEPKRNGGKGRERSKKAGDLVRVSTVDDNLNSVGEIVESERETRANSGRDSERTEIVDSVVKVEGRGRKTRANSSRVSKNDEVLDAVVLKVLKKDKNSGSVVKKETRTTSSRVWEKDKVLDSVVSKVLNKDKDSGSVVKRVTRAASTKVSKKFEDLDSVVKTTKRGGEKRATSSRVLKKDEISGSVAEILGRESKKRAIYSRVSKKGEILDSVMEDRTKKLDIVRILKEDGIVEDGILPPKNLGRERRNNAARISKKDEIVEDRIKESDIVGGSKEDCIVEDSIQCKKNLGRGRRNTAFSISQKDEIVEGSTEAPKNLGRKRRTNATRAPKKDEISDSVVDGSIQSQKNIGRGRPRRPLARSRASSAQILTEKDLLESASLNLPGETETLGTIYPTNTRNLRSTKNAKAQPKDEHSILCPLENLSQRKKLREGSHQLGQVKKTQKMSLTSFPKDLKDKRRGNKKSDKENCASYKRLRGVKPLSDSREKLALVPEDPPADDNERRGSDTANAKDSCSGQTFDGNKPIVGIVSTHKNKDAPACVVPKGWVGNGIPNTTSKYKEDSKISFHATPFEERLERALSDDKLFPHRKPISEEKSDTPAT